MDNVLHGPEPLVYCKSEPWTIFPIIAATTSPQYFQDHKQGDSLNAQWNKINNWLSSCINRSLSALLVLSTKQCHLHSPPNARGSLFTGGSLIYDNKVHGAVGYQDPIEMVRDTTWRPLYSSRDSIYNRLGPTNLALTWGRLIPLDPAGDSLRDPKMCLHSHAAYLPWLREDLERVLQCGLVTVSPASPRHRGDQVEGLGALGCECCGGPPPMKAFPRRTLLYRGHRQEESRSPCKVPRDP